jgi:alkaline phosphatase D
MVSRRTFLKRASLTTAGLAVGCVTEPLGEIPPDGKPFDGTFLDAEGTALDERRPAAVEPPENVVESALFPLGVAAGDIDGDKVTLWARYDGSAPLEATVWLVEADTYVAVHKTSQAERADGGFVRVEIDGLLPGRRYRYTFFEKNGDERIARSLIGQFRAPPASDQLVPLVFGAVSCTDNSETFETLARASETELDAFLFLGDTAYCDGAFTLDEYREKWVLHTGKSEHLSLRASTSLYATWDDHEVKNDFNPERVDAEQFANARKAFFENLPVRRVEEDPERIWRSRRWGLTAEIFILDSRSERKPSTLFTQDEQYISRAQMDWLKQGLVDSPCRFKLILNSVPITRFPNVWNIWQVDRWDAYDAQRREILSHIDDNEIPGVLWISGDFHLAKMGFVSPEGEPGETQVEALVGPGAQSPNPLLWSLIDPHFHWSSDENNYTQIHLDPFTGAARLVYIGRDGSVIEDKTYPL